MVTFRVNLPPAELSSNARLHWRRAWRAKADYRQDVGWDATAQAKPFWSDEPPPEKAAVSLVFCTKGAKGQFYQPRDEANAVDSFKAGFDGLVDAGLLKDDSRKHMTLGPVIIDSSRGPYVEVTVEPIGGKE